MAFANGYSYRRTVTIREDQITVGTNDLANFPMRFAGTYADLRSVANGGKVQHASGYDIRFETTGGVKLAHAINKWDATTGEIDARVKTAVGATADVVIYLYYGKAGLSATEADPTNVWDASTVAAYQFGDGTTLSLADATANALDLTNNGSVTAVAGVVGGAAVMGPTGSGKYLSHASDPKYNTSNYTLECWWQRVAGSVGSYVSMLSHGPSGSAGHYFLYEAASTRKVSFDIPFVVGGVFTSVAALTDNVWAHICLTKSGNVYTLYINGVQDTQVTNASAPTATGAFNVGAYPTQYGPSNIDEVIVSGVARAPEWVEASYQSTKAGATFYTVGSEEAAVSGSVLPSSRLGILLGM